MELLVQRMEEKAVKRDWEVGTGVSSFVPAGSAVDGRLCC